MKNLFRNAGADIPASIVVFLVALPLCLGVAVASDAAPVTGIIAGIVGGIVIGALSGSQLSVSGPAAGLTAIVAGAIGKLDSYSIFLLSVVLAGVIQLIFGFVKAGIIGEFIPNSVIKGMLAAIGIILILKQLPHFVGYDANPEGDEAFLQPDNSNTFSAILNSFQYISSGAIIIALIATAILLMYESKAIKKQRIFQLIPGPLIVVLSGIACNQFFASSAPHLALSGDHLVKLDVFDAPSAFVASLPHPDFSGLANSQVWLTALTLAIVASLETLLSIEAIDKIDPEKRISPSNRELKAQGVGNIVAGLLGGLPVTSVIVRSSANVSAGAKSKLSAIMHGVLLLLSVLFFADYLNLIPKASLAAILIFTGYKLAKVGLFTEHYRKGWDQFLPFVITVVAILLTDLLIGIIIGMFVGMFFVLRSNFKSAIFFIKDERRYLIRFRKEVSFLNKGLMKNIIESIPNNTSVLIDATKSEFIDRDVVDMVNDFIVNAETRAIRVYIKFNQTASKTFFKTNNRTIA
ncbi:MAG: SulP family inorganic anion transporter [Bacteroidetes bacterium]|uniref:SulP family inorganic anion transporter n=1 Tax=Phnomibacter sp. TaxID=2836217 RepID=UPI002FDE1A51|nr:SulP family inorganic anion transporter [Bacteroidota bacterium]